MDKFEVLFAAKAAEKEVHKRVSALEDECKAEILEQYRTEGVDRRRSKVFDGKSAYITVQEGLPSEEATRFDVVDMQALIDWMDETKPDTDCFAADNLAQFAQWYFNATGEVPEGCTLLRYMTEPKPPIAKLVVKEKPVLEALKEKALLAGEVNQLLLGDGDA